MKLKFLIPAVLVFLPILAAAQAPSPTPIRRFPIYANDTAAGACVSARKGYQYFRSSDNTQRICNGTAWGAAGGGGGITVGTTTSNGTADTFLKTNGSGAVADATGVTNVAGTPVRIDAQAAADNGIVFKQAATPTGRAFQVLDSGGNQQISLDAVNGFGPALRLGADSTVDFVNLGGVGQLRTNGNTVIAFAHGGNPAVAMDGVASGLKLRVTAAETTTVPLALQLAASPTAHALDVTSNGGSAGDLFNISAGGFTKSGGDKSVASPVTNATTTMSNLTDLTLTFEASGKYAGTFSFLAKNSTAAEGIKFDFNGGAATITSVQFGFTSTPPGVTLGTINSTALATAITATTATTADVWYTVNFIVTVNAAGTLIPRFAEVSHTSGTATVEAGSFSNIRKY